MKKQRWDISCFWNKKSWYNMSGTKREGVWKNMSLCYSSSFVTIYYELRRYSYEKRGKEQRNRT